MIIPIYYTALTTITLRMWHEKPQAGKATTQVVNPTSLPRKIDEYAAIADFLAGCKSPFTAKGYKTALNRFFNFAAVENKGFDPDVAITMNSEQLNPIVLKYAMELKKVADYG